MEKWHNRLYKFFIIGVFIIISDIIGLGIIGWANYRESMPVSGGDSDIVLMMYDMFIYVGSPLIYAFLVYTMLFTKFQFPVRFKGDGHGKKMKPYTSN